MNTRAKGFTLIELLIVISIIAMLSALSSSMITQAQRQAKRTNTQAILAKVTGGLEQFRADVRVFPNDRWGRATDDTTNWQAEYSKAFGAAGAELTPFGPQSIALDTGLNLNPAGASTLSREDIAVSEYSSSQVADLYWRNRLYYQLGTDISTADRDKVYQDLWTVANRYQCYGKIISATGATPLGIGDSGNFATPTGVTVVGYNKSDFLTPAIGSVWPEQQTMQYNRLARERSSLMVLAGDILHRGFAIPFGASARNAARIAAQVVPTPASLNRPGWAIAVLDGEIDSRRLASHGSNDPQVEILDAYGVPLIYLSQCRPGMMSTHTYSGYKTIYAAVTNRDQRAAVNADLVGLGRTGYGQFGISPDLNANAGYYSATSSCRFPTTTLASDLRMTASQRYINRYELWSAGPDGVWSYRRDSTTPGATPGPVLQNQQGLPVNLDNLSADDYLDGLTP